jgi:hypothetical protein
VLAAVCWLLASCAAGFNAQTQQQYQAGEGISDRSTDIYVLNALVVADDQGNGTLVGTLINQSGQADELQKVSFTGADGKPIRTTKLTSPVPLDYQQSAQLESDGLVRITGDGVRAGDFITATLTFGNAAPIELGIPIVPTGPMYTSVPVGPSSSS